MMQSPHAPLRLLREPLFRLLAINLAIGISAAVLTLGGLLALNPERLRDLMLADRAPVMAVALLLFGLVVTFGSVAMGTAVMAIGRGDSGGGEQATDADRRDHSGYSFVPITAPGDQSSSRVHHP